MLPVAYQTQGIGIGDVGIITDYGGFDFLFNICASHTDPINPGDMPENFSPLNPPLGPTDIRGYSEYKSDSYIASALVGTSQHDTESTGLIFESLASEGAILTMPRGSNSKDLGNVVRFRKYASANAEKWYKYVNEVRGREVRNGDVRLVIGYDSSTAWGMATFANLSEQRSFRLMFKPIGENSLGRTYGWEYSGIADVRSGPDICEVEKLRNLDQANNHIIYENQCLFVRTLNITLQDDVWSRLAADSEMFYLDDDYETQSPGQHSQSFVGNPNRSAGAPGVGDRGGRSSDTFMMEGLSSPAQHKSSEAVQFSHLAPALNIHPTKIINKLLLREKPNAKMAITGDGDWISVLKQTDQALPSSEILFARIISLYDICEEDGQN
ncbi:hypothetical protein CVT25_011735 [Psilocybe cyanescens]|uniref:Uncharacterized protein n=1 Tax=Psilocybe cyanescens TaxID=93625 RepID=A0A409WIC6_PSICY|nr:hypothetical protein CVT25_011735 [Psilocybe cyanescens]